MIKDKTIVDLLDRLKSEIDFDQAEVIDYWDGDLCAIGIKKESRMVYISTFGLYQDKIDGYDFDLELLDEEHIDNLHVIKEGRNVTEQALISEVKMFLGI